MFITTTEISVRENPGWAANTLKNIPAQQTVEVEGLTGQAVFKDDWIWHKLKGQSGWVAERNADGSQIALKWGAKQAPPVIPIISQESRSGIPAQPSQFVHQQLINAIQKTASAAGANGEDWLQRGRFGWLANDPNASYMGAPIINAPFFTREMKIQIINELNKGLKDAIAIPQATPVTPAQTTPAAPVAAQPVASTPAPAQVAATPAQSAPAATVAAEPAASTPAQTSTPAQAAASAGSGDAILLNTSFTHQDLINAFYAAAEAVGVADAFSLVKQAGIDYIAQDRKAIYSGTLIKDLPNISAEVKSGVITALNGKTPAEAPASNAALTASAVAAPTADSTPTSSQLSPFTTSGMQILYNGKPFRFVGVNLRELAYYGFQQSGITKWANPGHIDVQLDTARDMKAQVVRFFAPVNKLENGQDGTDIKDAIRRTKIVLDKLAARKMFALITLSDAKWSGFDVLCPGQYRGPNIGAYNNDWYKEGYKGTYMSFIKEFVKALSDHPAIFAWGIGNEMQVFPHSEENTPKMAPHFINFFKETSETIRKLSPTKLITTGVESSWHLFVLDAYERGKYSHKLYQIPTLDFATLHSYQDLTDRGNLGHNHDKILREVELAKNVWKKPLIMEELGPTGGHERGDGGVWINSTLQRLFDLGFSGAMQWGFHAPANDIGAGDGDSGMHRPGSNLVSHDWDSMFNAYKNYGGKYWV